MSVTPPRLAHVVYRTANLDRIVAWYELVFGARVVMRNEFIAFMTYDDEHHRLAFVADPRITEPGASPAHSGVDHVAYTLPSLDALLDQYVRLREVGITPYWTIDHGMTTSMYYRDPDGNQFEFQVDNFAEPGAAAAYVRSSEFEANPIGVEFDPEQMLAGRR